MTDRQAVRVCIVGTARRTWRDSSAAAPEPLGMWEQVARSAIDDIGTSADVARELDHLGVVHTQSWTYDDPVVRLAERLGRSDLGGTYSILAGTSPQRLIDQAAAAMVRGEVSAALVVGAEAQATLRRLADAGERPAWSHPHPNPVGMADMLREWYLPTEFRHGILPAWLTFALLAQARWAARGGTAADREAFFAEMAALSRVAARNPDAWFPIEHSAQRLATASADNRPLATPFTKLTTAFPTVDMAAANVVVTEHVADRWKVPEDRRVYLRGWGFERDASHIAARHDLASSPAMRAAAASALAMAAIDVAEVDVFDCYSCFGSAVQFARDAIGLPPDDPRPVSLTGGLPYYGGPGSNYMGHSISMLVDHLRAHPGRTGMVTGIGMHMTKHVAAVWSTNPVGGRLAADDSPQQAATDDDPGHRLVRDEVDGRVRVEAASALYDRNGVATSAVAVCALDDGSRCYATTEAPGAVASIAAGAWVGATATVVPTDGGTNRLEL